MPDYKIFDELANAYLTALDAVTSPWPLILLTSVFAFIWLVQVIGCAVDGLDGELHYRLCRERASGIPAYLYELAEDGDTDLPLPEHWAAEIQARGY